MLRLHLRVNGQAYELETRPNRTLLELLREDLGLISVKLGCGQGDCGACTIIMNGKAINACLVLAPQADDADILTLEGLAQAGALHPLQKRFSEHWAFQCGFCTAGMLMSAYALLLDNSQPSQEQVREAIEGNLCRCTNYSRAVEAIQRAADDVRMAIGREENPHA